MSAGVKKTAFQATQVAHCRTPIPRAEKLVLSRLQAVNVPLFCLGAASAKVDQAKKTDRNRQLQVRKAASIPASYR